MPRSFDRSIGTIISLFEIELSPIAFSGWMPDRPISFADIDWLRFLEGTGIDPRLVWHCVDDLEQMRPVDLIAGLVHVVQLFYNSAVNRQNGPTQRDLVAQLEAMRDAARSLSSLAQGGDGNGAPVAQPAWFREELGVDTESDGTFNATLRRATPGLHPLIHETLNQAWNQLSPFGPRQGEREREGWLIFASTFESVRHISIVFDKAIEMVREADDGKTMPGHRPQDEARRWARSRLLVIWRDVIGKPIDFKLTKTRARVELDEPEPGPCLSFVIAALEHIDPVRSHGYEALVQDLRRIEKDLPADRFVTTDGQGVTEVGRAIDFCLWRGAGMGVSIPCMASRAPYCPDQDQSPRSGADPLARLVRSLARQAARAAFSSDSVERNSSHGLDHERTAVDSRRGGAAAELLDEDNAQDDRVG